MALNLPLLYGKSFLDIGCNEGLFCGYAAFEGAKRVVGIDKDEKCISRAQARFENCTFIKEEWDRLPSERYDVILLASALHYADDQPALISRLMQQLTPTGVLVLELGIHPGHDNRWVSVKRGDIDTRLFPTRAKLMEVLEPYAYRFMGASVRQSGDPIPREVVHVRARQPMAYLLMADGGAGKTNIARRVFAPAGVSVINGDNVLHNIAIGQVQATPALTELIRLDHTPRRLDRSLARVFAAGLGEELVKTWISQGKPGQDLCLDAFVPAEFRPAVIDWVRNAGYTPVRLEWDGFDHQLRPQSEIEASAEAYQAWLTTRATGSAAAAGHPECVSEPIEIPTLERLRGHVDGLSVEKSGKLVVRGWCADEHAEFPTKFWLTLSDKLVPVTHIQVTNRPDVKRHFRLKHANVGFLATFDISFVDKKNLSADDIKVYASNKSNPDGVLLTPSKSLQIVRI